MFLLLFFFSLVLVFFLCSNVGMRWPIVEENEKCVVYYLPFQISFILHPVQECRSEASDHGGG